MKTLYLIDGSSFTYRAFYAIGHLSTSRGQPTNAIYGFIRMLRKTIEAFNPPYLAVIFDKGKATFRHKQYEQYKAHRKPMPDELVVQIPWIKKIVKAFNIPLIELDDYEADDIIATLAQKAEKEKFNVYIITGDKDMLQLVNDRIKVISPSKGDLVYDRNKVKERYGVEPSQIPELLALTGDSADNIQGVPGVGEKTAMKLLNSYKDIDGIYSSIDNINKPKLKTSIKEYREQVKENLGLVQLIKDVPLDITPDDCIKQQPKIDILKNIFRELEFKGLIKELLNNNNLKNDNLAKQETIADLGVWSSRYNEFKNSSKIGIVVRDNELAVAYEKNNSLVSLCTVMQDKVRTDIKELTGNPNIAIYSYDLKSLFKAIDVAGVLVKGPFFDVSIAEYLLKLSGKKITDEIQTESLVRCAIQVYQNVPLLEEMLIDERLFDLFHRIELPLIEVLTDMEKNGIRLDVNRLNILSEEFGRDLFTMTKKIYKLAGENFNINSPKQLEYILFEKLNLPKGKRTKTGYSTDVEVLSMLRKYHELPFCILEYRQLNKLKGTYIDPLPQMVDTVTGKLHTTFNQTGTATGRLSSRDPNLQNIPTKSDYGKRIRSAFIPSDKNLVFFGADYSQIELRILAHLSNDKELINAFREEKDIHTLTAQEIFEVDVNLVTADMRRQAKMVNFGIIYGMGARSLAKSLNINIKEAQNYIYTYFERYPGVSAYIENTLDEILQNGYVVTMFGRKRVIPEVYSQKQQIKSMGQRIAINTPIQGSAADIIKLAMIGVCRRFKKEDVRAKLLLQIHDELLFEVDSDAVSEIGQYVIQEMEHVVELKVPLKVNVKTGNSWADL